MAEKLVRIAGQQSRLAQDGWCYSGSVEVRSWGFLGPLLRNAVSDRASFWKVRNIRAERRISGLSRRSGSS